MTSSATSNQPDSRTAAAVATAPASSSRDTRFDALQVLRALAAGLVVVSHALSNWHERGVANDAGQPLYPLMGDLGVKLFFCISGFIIVYTARNMPSGMAGMMTFWRRRLVRIVPMYWIVLTLYIGYKLAGGNTQSLHDVALSYLFIPYRNDTFHVVQPILGVGWSLNYEMFFYLVFGLLLMLPRRWHTLALTAVMTALVAGRVVGLLVESAEAPLRTIAFHWADSIVLYFVGGVIAGAMRLNTTRWKNLRLSQSMAALLVTALVVSYAFILEPLWPVDAAMLHPVICAIAITACVLARPERLGRAWGLALLIGDASYSIYLTHAPLQGPLVSIASRLDLPLNDIGFVVLSLVGSATFGILAYRAVERPLYDRMR